MPPLREEDPPNDTYHMRLYTSLSPSHASAATQRACVQSWLDHGHDVVCVQTHQDDISASLLEHVSIERVRATASGRQDKQYVGLDAIIDAFIASGLDRCGIINGDIEILDPTGLLDEPRDGLACLRRHDHDGDKSCAQVFASGFDMFILTREQALSVPRSMFVIGQTFWDYWLPWSAHRAGHKLTTIDAPLLFHRKHPLNYAHHDWLRTVHHFCWLTHKANMSMPQRVSGDVHIAINRAITAP
jgi:hypothetical protein